MQAITGHTVTEGLPSDPVRGTFAAKGVPVDPQGRKVHREVRLEPDDDREGSALRQDKAGRSPEGGVGRSRAARDAHHLRGRLERCAATLDGDRRRLPEPAQGQEGLRGEAAQLRRVPPDAPSLGQPQVRLVRRRHRARERERERLLRMPRCLATVLREQGSHLAKAPRAEGRRGAERRGPQA